MDPTPLGFALSTKTYTGTVVEVHDGDTIVVDIPLAPVARVDQYLGFGCRVAGKHIIARSHVRLYGINAPELVTAEGVTARDFLAGRLTSGRIIVRAWTAGGHDVTEKYGRVLANVWADTMAGPSLNQQMLDAGQAIEYFGGAR